MKTMPWHQNTSLHKNYTKTSCWLGALVGILFYAKEITGYIPATKVCFSLDAPALNSCLQCFFCSSLFSSVKELKTVHTRRLPNKKKQYLKSILNPPTAKPPHHVSEANITVIHEHKNRNKQN